MKIKIAYINVMDCYSGGEIVLQRLVRGLDKKKFDICIYTKNTKFVDTLNCKECKLIIFNTQYQMQRKRGIGILFKAVKLFFISAKMVLDMKRKKIDIIHSNSMVSNIYFAIWAKLFGIKFIAHSHMINRGKVFKILYRYIGFCSNKVIVVSKAVKNNWLSYNVKDNKIEVVYSGLSNDFF